LKNNHLVKSHNSENELATAINNKCLDLKHIFEQKRQVTDKYICTIISSALFLKPEKIINILLVCIYGRELELQKKKIKK
jgi:hypothetical protein